MPYAPWLGLAGGTIKPSSFVKESTSADNTYLSCGAGETAVGIAQVGQRNVPGILGSDNAIAALVGENIMIYPPGSICPVHFADTTGAGAYVKSDGSGYAIPATSGDIACAYTREAGVAGSLGQVIVLQPGTKMP